MVLGEGGYVEPLTEESLPGFLWRGWFGHGGDAPAARLAAHLRWLLADPAPALVPPGHSARRTVEEGFALTDAARRQERVYEAAYRADRVGTGGIDGRRRPVGPGVRGAPRGAPYARPAPGSRAADDFNARPVRGPTTRPSARPDGTALWLRRCVVERGGRHRPAPGDGHGPATGR